MRHLMENDRERTGAVCGRIFPEGGANPIVWYQKFEYAVGKYHAIILIVASIDGYPLLFILL